MQKRVGFVIEIVGKKKSQLKFSLAGSQNLVLTKAPDEAKVNDKCILELETAPGSKHVINLGIDDLSRKSSLNYKFWHD